MNVLPIIHLGASQRQTIIVGDTTVVIDVVKTSHGLGWGANHIYVDVALGAVCPATVTVDDDVVSE